MSHPVSLLVGATLVAGGVGLLLDSIIGPSGEAAGTTVTVTTGGDAGGSGDCTLRQAIDSADTNASVGACTAGTGDDAVVLPAAVGPTLQLAGSGIAVGGPGAGTLTIQGPGAGSLDVRGGSGFSIFNIRPGGVTVSGMTVSHGSVTGGAAGAIFVAASAALTLDHVTVSGNSASLTAVSGGHSAAGGGIYSNGALTILNSTVSDNSVTMTLTAPTGGSSASASGGGIYMSADAPLVIDRSTINGNGATASAGIANAGALGGGVKVDGATSNTVSITRSTVSGNQATATGTASSFVQGGGIYVSAPGGATLESATIASNSGTATNTEGANAYLSNTTTRNTIVAYPVGGSNCVIDGTDFSGGFNLDDGTAPGTCGFDQAGDQTGVDPMLGAMLTDNGGPTLTSALLPDSPAIDRGKSFGEVADQRGLGRPVDFPGLDNAAGGDGTDIGAFEVQQACAGQATIGGSCPTQPPDTTPATPPPAAQSTAGAAKTKCKKGSKLKKGKCVKKKRKK